MKHPRSREGLGMEGEELGWRDDDVEVFAGGGACAPDVEVEG